MNEQSFEDITGFRVWPWGMSLDEILPSLPEGTTCARIPVDGMDAKTLLDRFEAGQMKRTDDAKYLRSEGPLHRYDDLSALGMTAPHLTWYEEALGVSGPRQLRLVDVTRPVLSQAVILPKTLYDGFEHEKPKEVHQKRTKDFLETLCTRYETIHQILTEKYGRPVRNSYGSEERRFWEAVWDRPSGAVQLHLGGNNCPYEFWISYCPKKHAMTSDSKAQEAFKKL